MKRPMIICAIILLLLSFFLYMVDTSYILIMLICTIASSVLLLISKRLREFAVITIIISLFLLSAARIGVNYIVPTENLYSEDVTLSGTVCDVARREEYNSIILRVTDRQGVINEGGKVRLISYYDNFYVGDELTAQVQISGVKDSDYTAINYAQGIFATGYIRQINEREAGRNLTYLFSSITSEISNIFFTNMDYEEASLCCAMAVGNREYESDEFAVAARRSGVTHIMVVSGMHMIVICGSLKKLLDFLCCNRQITITATFIFMIVFTCLCGFSGSVLRSAVMYGIYLMGDYFYKGHDGLNSLCSAAVIMFIFNPYVARDLGFLLSIASTAGIIVIMPIFEIHINRFVKNRLINSFLLATCVTVSAMITTLPITVYYYGEVSLTALPTNLLISAASSVMMIFCVVGAVLYLVPFLQLLSRAVLFVAAVIGKYILLVIKWLGNLEYSAVDCTFRDILIVYILVIAFLGVLKYTYIRKKAGVTDGNSIRADA